MSSLLILLRKRCLMKIQVLSDLHIDHSNYKLENSIADVIVIAGDLFEDYSQAPQFFEALPKKPVIIVLGNHDYYNKSISQAVSELKAIAKKHNHIHILEKDHIDINGVRFIGCTLWTDFKIMGAFFEKEAKSWCSEHVGDLALIKKKESGMHPWSVEDMCKEHELSVRYLEHMLLKEPFSGERVVVTHFAPHIKSVPMDNLIGAYIASDQERLMGFSAYWIHGHIHHVNNYELHGTKVISNPRGNSRLFNQSPDKNFIRVKIFDIAN